MFNFLVQCGRCVGDIIQALHCMCAVGVCVYDVITVGMVQLSQQMINAQHGKRSVINNSVGFYVAFISCKSIIMSWVQIGILDTHVSIEEIKSSL